MKLGTQTGSLVNHLIAGAGTLSEIKAGTPATILSWSDRSPATVFRVFKVGSSTIVEVRDDQYKRIDNNGISESQVYEYKTDVNGSRSYWKIDKNGNVSRTYKNEETGRWGKIKSGAIAFGSREKYHDFTF